MTKTIRTVSISDYIHHGKTPPEQEELDPAVLLSDLPQWLTDHSTELYIRIWDSSDTMEFQLEKFMARTYKCDNGKLKVGSKRFEIIELRAIIGFAVDCYDLDAMTESKIG